MIDKLIEEMARSDAEFDGRPFDNLGRADRDRYIARAARDLYATLAGTLNKGV